MRSPACGQALIIALAIMLCTAGCIAIPPFTKEPAVSGDTPTAFPTGSVVPRMTSHIIIETASPPPTQAMSLSDSHNAYRPLEVLPLPDDTPAERRFDFVYRSDSYTVKIPVNMSLHRAAISSPNKQVSVSNQTLGLFYRDMMDDPALGPFYEDLLHELRKGRYKGGYTLTDDEYLEYLVSFVQQIPYDDSTMSSTDPGNPRYPVEVIYDGTGDCDEKAMLLCGILSREGYDVALLAFPTLNHATAGIRIHLTTANPNFRVFSDGRRDYVYIETTQTRLIGFYNESYEDVPEPVVVPVGTGTLGYGQIDFVMDIFFDIHTIEKQLDMLMEKAGPSGMLGYDDYEAAVSYIDTYNFVLSTNDRVAAWDAVRKSELRHHTTCITCD
jgi:hypothetical protein